MIIFDGEINSKNVEEFLGKIESFIEKNKREKVEVYFSTYGGFTTVTGSLIRELNKINEKVELSLIFFRDLSSSGIDVLTQFKGRKVFLPKFYRLLIHGGEISIDYKGSKHTSHLEAQYMDERVKDDIVSYKENFNLTPKQIRGIESGLDIVFYGSKALKFLKESPIGNRLIFEN